MDGSKATLFVTQSFYLYYDGYLIFYLQTRPALACAAFPRSFQEHLLQVPLWSRSNSTESSLAKDNSTTDVKTDQGYTVLR